MASPLLFYCVAKPDASMHSALASPVLASSAQACCAIKAALYLHQTLLQTLLLAVSCSLQLVLLTKLIRDPDCYSPAICDHTARSAVT